MEHSIFLKDPIVDFEELTNQPSYHGSCWPTQLLRHFFKPHDWWKRRYAVRAKYQYNHNVVGSCYIALSLFALNLKSQVDMLPPIGIIKLYPNKPRRKHLITLADNTLKLSVYSLLPGRGKIPSGLSGGQRSVTVFGLVWRRSSARVLLCSFSKFQIIYSITSVMTFLIPYISMCKIAKEEKEEFSRPVALICKCCPLLRGATVILVTALHYRHLQSACFAHNPVRG